MILADDAVQIINPEHIIATLTDDVPFVVEMTVENGRGYRTAEENVGKEREIGVMPLDRPADLKLTLAKLAKSSIRDIPDFPKAGIVFKDITPILKDPALCDKVLDAFVGKLKGTRIDVIAGVESRGFLFGLSLACKLGVPFIPVRSAR